MLHCHLYPQTLTDDFFLQYLTCLSSICLDKDQYIYVFIDLWFEEGGHFYHRFLILKIDPNRIRTGDIRVPSHDLAKSR